MPHVLHLLKAPVPDHALAAIQRQSREPGTTLTVVLREGAEAPPLPSGVQVRRLADTLTYSELLDLIFSADQVISW
ncbi:MAG: hypothetical protein HYV92_04605 [Candidatus Rokubacteria bacterium]|nr:hypothetical protein [Candidatus Rokubacteria bacterium]MBI2553703.1 hypothetical protein [Candidatus Rokubacteria bacterium]